MAIQNRYDFVLLFDVKDGNPNGDPDAGNLPRSDAETGCGLVTDVCLKRKIRNYVALAKEDQQGFEIYVQEKAVLNRTHERAYAAIESPTDSKADGKKNKSDVKSEDLARQWMCKNFYDVRAFGAVMSTGDKKCGQVRGPVQLTFARSVDPIVTSEHCITRMAVTNEKDAEKERTMGRKFTVPYGLYRAHGFVSASLADQTGFSEVDFELLLKALTNMFENDRSAARGEMVTRGLYVFKHTSKLGDAQAHTLFERVTTSKATDMPARSFADYKVTIDEAKIPQGVSLQKIVC